MEIVAILSQWRDTRNSGLPRREDAWHHPGMQRPDPIAWTPFSQLRSILSRVRTDPRSQMPLLAATAALISIVSLSPSLRAAAEPAAGPAPRAAGSAQPAAPAPGAVSTVQADSSRPADSLLHVQPGPARRDSAVQAVAPATHLIPDPLPMQEGIKDPVFSILVGLVGSGTYGTITEEQLGRTVTGSGAKSRLPYKTVEEVTRTAVDSGRTALITVKFRGKLDLPIPYSILGYHPGSFTATQTCVFREWLLGPVKIDYVEDDHGKTRNRSVELEEVHLFGIKDGDVNIDIDAFIDKLMGGNLDDTDVTALMLCRYKGEWLGFAMGYNADKSGRSGVFSFAKDEIMFPTPDELRTVARTMRGRSEVLARQWADAGTGGMRGR